MKDLIRDIQNQPPEKKLRLIWSILGGVAIILVLTWILVGNARRADQKGPKEFFNSISNEFKQSQQNTNIPKPQ